MLFFRHIILIIKNFLNSFRISNNDKGFPVLDIISHLLIYPLLLSVLLVYIFNIPFSGVIHQSFLIVVTVLLGLLINLQILLLSNDFKEIDNKDVKDTFEIVCYQLSFSILWSIVTVIVLVFFVFDKDFLILNFIRESSVLYNIAKIFPKKIISCVISYAFFVNIINFTRIMVTANALLIYKFKHQKK